MANEDEQKLLFRMKHIIPRGLASPTISNNPNTIISSSSSFEEIEIQMTWGKVAGETQ